MTQVNHSKVKFHPMPGRIVVQLDERDRVGNLFLPSSSRESRVLGKILSIGEDEGDGEFYNLQVGDMVMFGQHAGVKVTIGQDKALILGTREILCRVEWEDGEGRRPEVEGVGGDEAHVEDLDINPEEAEVINLRSES